jgi:hypothetical protein
VGRDHSADDYDSDPRGSEDRHVVDELQRAAGRRSVQTCATTLAALNLLNTFNEL